MAAESEKVIPVVAALGTIPKKLELYREKGGIEVITSEGSVTWDGQDTWRSVWRGCWCSVRDRHSAWASGRSSYDGLKHQSCEDRDNSCGLTYSLFSPSLYVG